MVPSLLTASIPSFPGGGDAGACAGAVLDVSCYRTYIHTHNPPGCFGGRVRGRLRAASAFSPAFSFVSTVAPAVVAPAQSKSAPRTFVYIDGFNLYYGALKNTAFRWLDLEAFCRLLMPKNDIVKIKYFTARVKPRPTKPDTAIRQQAYLRALGTLPSVEIYYGHYLSHPRKLPLADPAGGVVVDANGKVQFANVVKEEEKGSDVNLAAHLMHDAHRAAFETAVVITNDSDLATPVRLVVTDLKLPVVVANPHATNPYSNPSVQLKKAASFVKPVRTGMLSNAQFPPILGDAGGQIHKPPTW